MLLLLLALLPLSLHLDWQHGDASHLSATLRVAFLPVPLSRLMRRMMQRTPSTPPGVDPLLLWKQRALRLIGTFLRSDHARRLLLRFLRLRELTGDVRLALSDASGTARLAGFLSGAALRLRQRLPSACISVAPDFLAPRTRIRLRCMISCPLGILALTSLLVLVASLGEAREHPLQKEA